MASQLELFELDSELHRAYDAGYRDGGGLSLIRSYDALLTTIATAIRVIANNLEDRYPVPVAVADLRTLIQTIGAVTHPYNSADHLADPSDHLLEDLPDAS